MKLAKLSLAAMVVAGLASSSFAADTLADAFAKGKVSGELRAWYWDYDSGSAATSSDILNTALNLGYITDSFYGFSMGATFQTNYAPFADDTAKNTFAAREYGSGAVLSEAYLGYKMKNTNVKIGRQFITTPLVAGSGSHIVKESFEGATVVNTDLPGTTLVAGYVSKFQSRTTKAADASISVANTDIGDFTKRAVFAGAGAHSFDGAYTAAIINKSIANLTLTGQYARVMDVAGAAVGDVDVYHLEAGYVLPMSSFELGFGLVYRASSTDKEAGLDGNYMGAKVGVSKLAGFGAAFAYGTSDGSDGLVAGMGNGADSLYTGTVIRGGSNTYAKDTDSYRFDVSYDFSKVGVAGLTALAQYAVSDQGGATGIDYTTLHLGATYAVPALKGLAVTLQYETQEKEVGSAAGVDADEIRFMANYKF